MQIGSALAASLGQRVKLPEGRLRILVACGAASGIAADPAALAQDPPTPLPGYQLIEITITSGSPAAGRKLGDINWPHASTPVSVQRGRRLRPPGPEITLAMGDRVNLLTAASGGAPSQAPCSDRAWQYEDLP